MDVRTDGQDVQSRRADLELGGPAECIAQAPSMLRLLLRLEHAGTIPRFVNDGDNIFDDCSEPCCPCCRCEVVGHNAGCALDVDLTACGLATAYVDRPIEFGGAPRPDRDAAQDWDYAADSLTGLADLLIA